jgi:hypothetical protein
MKKQTATEYFYDMVIGIFTKYHEEDVPTIDFGKLITEAFDTAKAIEREYMMLMYNAGKSEGVTEGSKTAKEYFTDTFNQ